MVNERSFTITHSLRSPGRIIEPDTQFKKEIEKKEMKATLIAMEFFAKCGKELDDWNIGKKSEISDNTTENLVVKTYRRSRANGMEIFYHLR